MFMIEMTLIFVPYPVIYLPLKRMTVHHLIPVSLLVFDILMRIDYQNLNFNKETLMSIIFRRVFLLSLFSFAPFVSNCGKKSESSSSCTEGGKVQNICFKNLSASGLVFNGTSISGTGNAVALDVLADKIDEGRNIALTLTLQDTGSLTLKSFSKSDLTSGVNLKFSRSASQLSLSFVNNTGETSTKILSGIDAAGEIKILVDVHNDEDPPHVVLWNGAGTFNKDTTLLNSEDTGEIAPTTKGADKYWGVTLDKAVLTGAALSDPKDEE